MQLEQIEEVCRSLCPEGPTRFICVSLQKPTPPQAIFFLKTPSFRDLRTTLFSTGRPRFGSVQLRFGNGTVQAVPVFGSGGSSAKMVFCVSVQFNRIERTVPVPVSFPGKRFRRFRFRFRFREKRFRRFRFPVPVRFLSHPVSRGKRTCRGGFGEGLDGVAPQEQKEIRRRKR